LKIDRLLDSTYELNPGIVVDYDLQLSLPEFQLEYIKWSQDWQVRITTTVRKIEEDLFKWNGNTISTTDTTYTQIRSEHFQKKIYRLWANSTYL